MKDMSAWHEEHDTGVYHQSIPSTTWTLKAHELLLFDVSRPTQVTEVIPSVKLDPEIREHAMLAPGALSDTLAVKMCVAYDLLVMVVRSTDPGHDTTGSSRSRTVILNEHDPVLPAASTAVHVTFVDPTGNSVDELGAHDDVTTPTLSLVTGLAYGSRPYDAPRSVDTVWSDEHVSLGFSSSDTVTENEHVALLFALSVAVQVTGVDPITNDEPDPGLHDTDGVR